MINSALLDPKSITIVGASNSLEKPGGGLVKNLIDGGYKGEVYPLNPKQSEVQGLKAYNSLEELPNTDMAIMAVPAEVAVQTVEFLAKNKNTRAYIIISAGFSEIGEEGKKLEEKLQDLVCEYDLAIIGPNCIGVINPNYKGVFVSPPPPVVEDGVDFVSASGALAVFLFEVAAKHGLRFKNIFTVGNSLDIGVEDVLKHWDESFEEGISSTTKMVYVEQIRKPDLFFKHIQSLRRKGCHVIVLKPGDSEAGARAALSHTGALAGDSKAIGWLIEKSGAIRVESREELVHIAAILSQKQLNGKRIAIVTHAGGPAVMLTDALNYAGMEIPEIDEESQEKILEFLFCGSSASNPIDMLATATHEQLRFVLKHCDGLDYIDGIVVIYGKTGMEDLNITYKTLSDTIIECKKPVYPVMPSVNTAADETNGYIGYGNVAFFDEVVFANALNKVVKAPKVYGDELFIPSPDFNDPAKEDIILEEKEVFERLKWAGIPTVNTQILHTEEELNALTDLNYPVVAKVLGILHKTEVNGVVLNIQNFDELKAEFNRLTAIEGSTGILIQEMISGGTEIYMGAKMHPGIGYSIHVGVGGIFIELVKDISSMLAPVNLEEAKHMLSQLKAQKLFKGFRNMPAINMDQFAQIVVTFSNMFKQYPDIAEIDLNPLIATADKIIAVDARIIKK